MECVAKIEPEMQGRVHGICCENRSRNAGMRAWNVLRKWSQKCRDACMECVAKMEPEKRRGVFGSDFLFFLDDWSIYCVSL